VRPPDLQAVTLTRFDAAVAEQSVMLTWHTSAERGSAGFEVLQRRADEAAFQPLAFVDGGGTTDAPRDYSYQVDGLEPGAYVFRLRFVSASGRTRLGPEVEVRYIPGTHVLTAPFPNPAAGPVHVSLLLKEPQRVHVAVFDALGRRVAVLHDGQMGSEALNTLTFDGTGLPDGLYFIRARGDDFAETKEVVLAGR
jgi:hypothetical protein